MFHEGRLAGASSIPPLAKRFACLLKQEYISGGSFSIREPSDTPINASDDETSCTTICLCSI